MPQIDIYGDIVAFKYFDNGNEYDLADLKNALNNLDINENETLTVNIHTHGGDTTTAFGMYNLLKRFKVENNINIRTRVDGYCASSGVIILLAGDQRVGNAYIKPFVHNAWTWSWDGINKETAQKIYEELEAVDSSIAELYASETSITKDEALQFMSESRELTLEECQKYGFYTELENIAIVESSNPFNSIIKRNIQNRKNNSNTMDKNKKNAWNALVQQAKKFFKAENKIIFTATNEELDFYELTEDQTPAVGDKARFDGKPAGDTNDGVYILASGETYKFSGEELTEIVEKKDEDDKEQEIENLKKEINALNEKISALNSIKEKAEKDLTEAKNIIKGFNALYDEKNEEEETRSPQTPANSKFNLSKILKNIK